MIRFDVFAGRSAGKFKKIHGMNLAAPINTARRYIFHAKARN